MQDLDLPVVHFRCPSTVRYTFPFVNTLIHLTVTALKTVLLGNGRLYTEHGSGKQWD